MRKGSQYLVEISNCHFASGFSFGCSAFHFSVGLGIVVGKSFAGRCCDIFQSSSKKFLSHRRQVIVPLGLRREFHGCAPVRGEHELDVLHTFLSLAVGDTGDFFSGMRVRNEGELIEGGKEVVVTGFLSRAPVAHRPCIDDLVVKNVIVIGAADQRLRCVVFASIARRSQNARRCPVDAEVVGNRPVDHVFGVERSPKVVVEIGAFRHVMEEGQQQRRLFTYRIEIAGRFLFGRLRYRKGADEGERKAASGSHSHEDGLRGRGIVIVRC